MLALTVTLKHTAVSKISTYLDALERKKGMLAMCLQFDIVQKSIFHFTVLLNSIQGVTHRKNRYKRGLSSRESCRGSNQYPTLQTHVFPATQLRLARLETKVGEKKKNGSAVQAKASSVGRFDKPEHAHFSEDKLSRKYFTIMFLSTRGAWDLMRSRQSEN